MTDNKHKSTVNPLVAGVTGAVVGAGVAVATSMLLKDEKNKKKLTDAYETVKKSATGYAKKIGDAMPEMQGKIAEGKMEVKDIVSDARATKPTKKTTAGK